MGSSDRWGNDLSLAFVKNAEHDRHEQERRDRSKNQATNDSATEWRILFAALAETERHWRHADDHRECGHQNGPEAHESRVEGGRHRVAKLFEAFAREADDQNA